MAGAATDFMNDARKGLPADIFCFVLAWLSISVPVAQAGSDRPQMVTLRK